MNPETVSEPSLFFHCTIRGLCWAGRGSGQASVCESRPSWKASTRLRGAFLSGQCDVFGVCAPKIETNNDRGIVTYITEQHRVPTLGFAQFLQLCTEGSRSRCATCASHKPTYYPDWRKDQSNNKRCSARPPAGVKASLSWRFSVKFQELLL